MALDLVDLDSETREQMLAELSRDESDGSLYLSPRLTDEGRRAFSELLREAFARGDDTTLANALRGGPFIKAFETGTRRGGRPEVVSCAGDG